MLGFFLCFFVVFFVGLFLWGGGILFFDPCASGGWRLEKLVLLDQH